MIECHLLRKYTFFMFVSIVYLIKDINWELLLWKLVSYIKGGIQAKGIWKQDPEANIWAQEGWEWGVEKAP